MTSEKPNFVPLFCKFSDLFPHITNPLYVNLKNLDTSNLHSFLPKLSLLNNQNLFRSRCLPIHPTFTNFGIGPICFSFSRTVDLKYLENDSHNESKMGKLKAMIGSTITIGNGEIGANLVGDIINESLIVKPLGLNTFYRNDIMSIDLTNLKEGISISSILKIHTNKSNDYYTGGSVSNITDSTRTYGSLFVARIPKSVKFIDGFLANITNNTKLVGGINSSMSKNRKDNPWIYFQSTTPFKNRIGINTTNIGGSMTITNPKQNYLSIGTKQGIGSSGVSILGSVNLTPSNENKIKNGYIGLEYLFGKNISMGCYYVIENIKAKYLGHFPLVGIYFKF